MTKKKISEPAREIAVVWEYDVIVAGAGPAGVAATIATRNNISPRSVDVKDIQAVLLAAGVEP